MPTLHAVLIGINRYNNVGNLRGCVNDVLAMGAYLQTLGKAPNEHAINLQYLLSPNGETEKALIAEKGIGAYQEPTRANIIAAFEHFKQAASGDYCVLHYSGHGHYMPAPEAFRLLEPTGQCETLVCMDSGDDGVRDLMDKELAWLISDALQDPATGKQKEGVHFLAIMDCCHSGSGLRGDDPDLMARMPQESRGQGVVINLQNSQDILGFTHEGNSFYLPFDPANPIPVGGLRHARYISLAAARSNELAQERDILTGFGSAAANAPSSLQRHGVFTFSLLSSLYQSGTNISYAELMRRAEMEVRGRVNNQIPELETTEPTDQNAWFLGNGFKTPKAEYQVAYNRRTVEWRINGGSIHGIVPSTEKSKTTVLLSDGREVPVIEVRGMDAILDPTKFTEPDKDNFALTATVQNNATATIKVGLGNSLSVLMREALVKQWEMVKHKIEYVQLDATATQAEYWVQAVEGNAYILCRPGDFIPLFIRTPEPEVFINDLQKVGKWSLVMKLDNPNTQIPREDIEIVAGLLEGVAFDGNNLANFPDSAYRFLPPNPASIDIPRKNDKQSALKVRINNKSTTDAYWVAALYIAENFKITNQYLSCTQIGPGALQKEVDLKFVKDGRDYPAIPLTVDVEYLANGISEVTDHIFIFVGRQKFDLGRYCQDKLKMDPTRTADFEEPNEVRPDDWTVIKIPLHIQRPLKKVPLMAGQAQKMFLTINDKDK